MGKKDSEISKNTQNSKISEIDNLSITELQKLKTQIENIILTKQDNNLKIKIMDKFQKTKDKLFKKNKDLKKLELNNDKYIIQFDGLEEFDFEPSPLKVGSSIENNSCKIEILKKYIPENWNGKKLYKFLEQIDEKCENIENLYEAALKNINMETYKFIEDFIGWYGYNPDKSLSNIEIIKEDWEGYDPKFHAKVYHKNKPLIEIDLYNNMSESKYKVACGLEVKIKDKPILVGWMNYNDCDFKKYPKNIPKEFSMKYLCNILEILSNNFYHAPHWTSASDIFEFVFDGFEE
jgi:hypothetical protein